jgi:hypothetical protein
MSEMTLLSQKVMTKVIKTKSLAKLYPDNQAWGQYKGCPQ